MRKASRWFALLTTIALALAVSVPAAPTAPASKNMKKKESATAKDSMLKSSAAKEEKAMKNGVLGSAEDLSGTIRWVDPQDQRVTLAGPNGVLYDFVLSKTTQLELGDKTVKPDTLNSERQKHATVHFVPTRNGNLAEKI